MSAAQSPARIARSVALLGLLQGCLLGCTALAEKQPVPPPPREIEVLTVRASEVRDAAEYLGSVLSRQNVTILPQVDGYVRKVLVAPGQEVQAGDPLVELDAQRERAALDSATAEQRAAATKAELALRTYQRTQALHADGLVTGQELDRAEAEAKAAEAERLAATARASEQRVTVGFHAVRAPFAGTVGDVHARVGDFVGAATPLTSITQGAKLEVEVRIPAERARAAKRGSPIEILDASGRVELSTTLTFVSPEADPRTQLVAVNAAFPNDLGLRPSEMVRVRLVYGSEQALQVPVLAIVRQSGQAFVFAVEDAPTGPIVTRRPISLGALVDQNYVVTQGLAEGDRIAVSSLQLLRDKTAIRIKAPAAAATAN